MSGSNGAGDIAAARRAYAEELRYVCRLRSAAVERAFATVPRERFLGPGPWKLFHFADGYWDSPDADPRHVYHNILVAIDPARGLNNGEPSFWARIFDRLDVAAGSRVLHIGAGTGYYTAILAEIVGSAGTVSAIEVDPALAERAHENLAAWDRVTVAAGDAAVVAPDAFDAIVVSAGATHPPAAWLDALADSGRLALPLSRSGRLGGFVLEAQRKGTRFAARSLGMVWIFPCAGARDAQAQTALDDAFAKRGYPAIKSLRRDSHAADDSCWLHGEGYCLSNAE